MVPTDETGRTAVTENTIAVSFTIPEELNSNGVIQRVRIIMRVFGSTSDQITNYYHSSRAQPPDLPPYFALELDVVDKRKRGLVKRQANVSL